MQDVQNFVEMEFFEVCITLLRQSLSTTVLLDNCIILLNNNQTGCFLHTSVKRIIHTANCNKTLSYVTGSLKSQHNCASQNFQYEVQSVIYHKKNYVQF